MNVQRKRGAWLGRVAVLSLVLFLAGPFSAHQGFVPPLTGFIAFAIGGMLGLVTFVAGTVRTFRRGLREGQEGVLFGGVPAAVFVYLVYGAADFPRINDISTDLENPPRFTQAASLPANRDRDMSYPEAFVPVVRESYPDLEPLVLDVPPRKVFDRAILIARGTPTWSITSIDQGRLVFEGTDTSRIFRFRDDFVVRVQPSGNGARVDMRSKSRDGQGDLGANAHRIRTFLAKLRATS